MTSLIAIAFAAAEETHAAAGEHSEGLLQDTAFWVFGAFLLVMFIFARMGVHKTIGSGLDKRTQEIADELDEARKMREEAQELLATFQRRQREADDEAAAIIDQARKDAERMAADARQKINEQTDRRIRAAEEKITRAEAQALSEVRAQAADLAVEAARTIIRERMDSGAQGAYLDKEIAGLGDKLN